MARVISHLNLSNDLGRFVSAPKRPTARTDTGATQTTDTSSSSDPAADFRALFNGGFSTPANNTPPPPPTAESVFGPNPWGEASMFIGCRAGVDQNPVSLRRQVEVDRGRVDFDRNGKRAQALCCQIEEQNGAKWFADVFAED